tara:strand:+ start:432 stop:647 length:216 start_codon:yes stop_codon:yes gene_type:complete
MFEVGMSFIRVYGSHCESGQIDWINDGDIGVKFWNGTSKVYTEDCVMKNLGRRILVTRDWTEEEKQALELM